MLHWALSKTFWKCFWNSKKDFNSWNIHTKIIFHSLRHHNLTIEERKQTEHSWWCHWKYFKLKKVFTNWLSKNFCQGNTLCKCLGNLSYAWAHAIQQKKTVDRCVSTESCLVVFQHLLSCSASVMFVRFHCVFREKTAGVPN